MLRTLLLIAVVVLLGLIVVDKLSHRGRDRPTPVAVTIRPSEPAKAPTEAARRPLGVSTSRPSASEVDPVARLLVRNRLRSEHTTTFLDSLVSATDSIIRRWPDPYSQPLRITIVPGGPAGFVPRMADYVHEAFDQWQKLGLGFTFRFIDDTSGADITVHWVDQFPAARAGQTDITWDRTGRISHASVLLAVRSSTGDSLSETALRMIALHEAGHALALPHSADSNDAMYPSAHAVAPSDRDRRTLSVLYELPPGDIRDPGGRQ
jgi:hypothetical protein